MNKRQFVNKVLNNIPEFSCIDNYFYVHPVGHVLSGFTCEVKPSWADIHQFTFPLFDRKDFLHLTYSKYALARPECFIDYNSQVKNNLADEFINRIQPLTSRAYEASSLDGFIDFLQQEDKFKNRVHPLRRVALGFAYTLLGEEDRAFQALKAASEDNFVKLDKKTHTDCLNILAFVENGEVLDAQKLLLGWESKTRDWLKLD